MSFWASSKSRADYYQQQSSAIYSRKHNPLLEQHSAAREKSNEASVGLEDLGREYVEGFRSFSETAEYEERFPEFKEARSPVARNRSSSENAQRQVPKQYLSYGRARTDHYSSQHSLRSLKTLTNRFPNELDGIGAINRATLDRVQKARTGKHGFKGQSKDILASTADLDNAVKLHGKGWTVPTEDEIETAGLFIDYKLGTVTSVPQHELSYAATVVSEAQDATQLQPMN